MNKLTDTCSANSVAALQGYKKQCVRWHLAFLAVLTGFLLLDSPLHAATELADVPVAVANSSAKVKSNIMFTLDDSGSMQWEALPDSAIRWGVYNGVYYPSYNVFPPEANIYGGSDYGRVTVDFSASNPHATFMRSSNNNKVYYNPAVRYTPWSKSDGTSYGNALPSAAPHNPEPCLASNPSCLNAAPGARNLTIDNTDSAWWLTSGGWVYQSYTYYPATYFQYKGVGNVNNTTSYTRVEIKPANAPFSKAAARSDCAGSSCTYAEEIQNFANWYTYYRSRILASRAGIGKAFGQLTDSSYRVGFGAINQGTATIDGASSPGTLINGVRLFTGTDRQRFFDSLYRHIIPAANTPLRRALDDVGQYYSRADDSGPWGPAPQLTCRQSYNILMTDGYWNGAAASTAEARANVDGSNGPTITSTSGASYQYTPAYPYRDTWSDTLADVAMYYWNRDLRPTLDNNVPPNSSDPAFWQHMSTFTVGLGVSGTLSYPSDLAALTSGAKTWPNPASGDQQKLDDLWHAAENGRGEFFNAADPDQFAQAMIDALNNIASRIGAAAANAVANPNIAAGSNQTFVASYDASTWSGEIRAYTIDPITGAISSTSSWSPDAQARLDARTTATSDTRKIATSTGPFQWTSLSAAQQALLNSATTPPGPSDGQTVLEFLRGWRGREMGNANCNGSATAPCLYRKRAHVLGDIINAGGVVVGAPLYHYLDAGYNTYITSKTNRAKALYQGANDGMLHAFDAATGAENWAYIPGLLLPTLRDLSKASGFTHKYYVDATPAVADVDFGFVNGTTYTPNWQTILVGGLGKGGRGYYALNVTDPAGATEATVAAKKLWEFTEDNMGFSFGKPVIVKTRATGEGWVVMLTSGYNNVPAANGGPTGSTTGDGKGHLYVLNAQTGALLKKIDILPDLGSVANPSGFTHISAYVNNTDLDNTVEYVYGGDLNGYIWRFDFTGPTVASWNVTTLPLAKLKDGLGNPQPVTTIPELGQAVGSAGKRYRMVFVGTGKYLGLSDISNTQVQSMYGLKDAGIAAATIDGRGTLIQQTMTTSGTTRSATYSKVNLETTNGWLVDLPVSGERVNTHPALNFGVLAFTTNVPNDDACSIYGGSSWLNYLDYKTGGAIKLSTGAYSTVSEFLGNALASGVTAIVADGTLRVTGVRSGALNPNGGGGSGSGGGLIFERKLPIPGTTARVMWRELINK